MSLLRVKPEVFRFQIDDFQRRFARIDRTDRDDVICSEGEFIDSRGNRWGLFLGPCDRARRENNPEDMTIKVLFGMEFHGIKDVHVETQFYLRDSSGKVFRESYDNDEDEKFYAYEAMRGSDHDECCAEAFIKLSELIDKRNNLLVRGSLHIDVMLRYEPSSFHVPSNPFVKNGLKLLNDNKFADISFQVGDDRITAHKLIINANAPLLASFIEANDPGVPLVIKDVAPDVFREVLRHIYGGFFRKHVHTEEEKRRAIISAADRFGLVELKLAVEAELVRETPITMNNVIDWLLFADAKTCSLLKERAMAYFVARASDCLRDESLSKALKQSPKLMEELMLEISICANNDRRLESTTVNGTVDEIRKGLNVRGLDVDGSREMLVSRLSESINRKRPRQRAT